MVSFLKTLARLLQTSAVLDVCYIFEALDKVLPEDISIPVMGYELSVSAL